MALIPKMKAPPQESAEEKRRLRAAMLKFY